MHGIRYALVLLVTLPLTARADQPMFQSWVKLHVLSCLPVTFEAPLYQSSLFVKGDSHRTAVVTGRVVESGLHDYSHLREYGMPQTQVARAAEEVTAALPPKNSQLSVALRQWDEPFCASAQGEAVRFDIHSHCDTVPMSGICLVPLPKAVPVSSD
jgi:hypothetical protein